MIKEMSKMWNLQHGCKKYSDGCKYCYVYRGDERHGKDASEVYQTKQFDLPVRRKKNGDYTCPSGTFFWTCFTSDFLLEESDQWRDQAWDMIRERSDCHFLFITKRIVRFQEVMPPDWADGWPNVSVCCTVENRKEADTRLPVFLALPIRHKAITAEPLLEALDLSPYLNESIREVIVGGESGPSSRLCRFEWVQDIRKQCIEKNVTFHFKQTGAKFEKDGKVYRIPKNKQHAQARAAGIHFSGRHQSYLR